MTARPITRRRYARETAVARMQLKRASDRANQASTWGLFAFFACMVCAVAAISSCGQSARVDRDIPTVAQLLQRQTEVMLERLPVVTPKAAAMDLPAAIAGGA